MTTYREIKYAELLDHIYSDKAGRSAILDAMAVLELKLDSIVWLEDNGVIHTRKETLEIIIDPNEFKAV